MIATRRGVVLMHRSPVTECLHWGARVDCTLSACVVGRCVDPDDTEHEHCPLHGCVEYVCCEPSDSAGPT